MQLRLSHHFDVDGGGAGGGRNELDAGDRLGEIRAPTLAVSPGRRMSWWTGATPSSSPSASRARASSLFPGCGHPLLGRAERFAVLVKEFLR